MTSAPSKSSPLLTLRRAVSGISLSRSKSKTEASRTTKRPSKSNRLSTPNLNDTLSASPCNSTFSHEGSWMQSSSESSPDICTYGHVEQVPMFSLTNSDDIPDAPPIPTTDSILTFYDQDTHCRYCKLPFASDWKQAYFHEQFPSLPKNERLIKEFHSAAREDILIQGKLFISENFVCFKSTVLSHVPYIIPFENINDLQLKTTMRVPNSISIETEQFYYFFTNFINRTEAFEILSLLWNSHVDPKSKFRKANRCRHSEQVKCSHCVEGIEGIKPTIKDRAEMIGPHRKLYENMQTSLKSLNSDSSQSIYEKEGCGCQIDHSERNVIIDRTWECPLPEMFEYMFTADKSGFQVDFLGNFRKLKQVKASLWSFEPNALVEIEKMQPQSLSELQPGMTRQLEYILPLNVPLVKQTRAMVDQKILFIGSSFVCVEAKTVTPDVPSGTSFASCNRYCLTKRSSSSTNVLGSYVLEWSKSSWIKSQIESNSWNGNKGTYDLFESALDQFMERNSSTTALESRDREQTLVNPISKSEPPVVRQVHIKEQFSYKNLVILFLVLVLASNQWTLHKMNVKLDEILMKNQFNSQ